MGPVQPKTRYAKSGGVSIAYQVMGDGPFDVVLIPGFISNVEEQAQVPTWQRIFERLTSFSRLIVWDKRGTGLSDPVARVPTLDERADDLESVMDAAGSRRGALVGMSEGGALALLFAATRPERVSALVLFGTTPKFMASPDWPFGWQPSEFEEILAEVDERWGEGALLDLFGPSLAGNEVVREFFGRYQRKGASPAMARATLEAAAEIDCRAVLPAVSVPTLVLHRSGDRVADIGAARFMAEQIPGAIFVELPGEDHGLTLGDPQSFLDAVSQFLTGRRSLPPADRVLATVVFTDIVDSTAHAARLGDREWRRLLEAHDDVVRRELERSGGREIKTLGDGFLATFVAPSRAIVAACAIRDELRRRGIEIRAGLHTGECEVLERDVAGVAVHIAARVAALASAGEVLVSSTVKDLVVGAGLEFDDRGPQTLKGVPGEWRLFAVTG